MRCRAYLQTPATTAWKILAETRPPSLESRTPKRGDRRPKRAQGTVPAGRPLMRRALAAPVGWVPTTVGEGGSLPAESQRNTQRGKRWTRRRRKAECCAAVARHANSRRGGEMRTWNADMGPSGRLRRNERILRSMRDEFCDGGPITGSDLHICLDSGDAIVWPLNVDFGQCGPLLALRTRCPLGRSCCARSRRARLRASRARRRGRG